MSSSETGQGLAVFLPKIWSWSHFCVGFSPSKIGCHDIATKMLNRDYIMTLSLWPILLNVRNIPTNKCIFSFIDLVLYDHKIVILNVI